MTRHSRRFFTALFAAFALLMSQLAISAHVCGVLESASKQAEMSASCPELMDSSIVCQQHCQFGESNVDQGKPFAPMDVTSVPFLRIDQPYVSVPLVRRPGLDSPPPDPPPATRFSVLRI